MQKTLAVVNLKNIRENAVAARSLASGKKFYAVVKADAYGHGAEQVALALEDVVDGFCVAIVDEGIRLRVAGVTKPVLVFTPPLCKEDGVRAMFYSLTMSVSNIENAQFIRGCPYHLKVNTGMNRLGCDVSEIDKVILSAGKDNLEGVYSHMFCPENSAYSAAQLSLFKRAEERAKQVNSSIFAHFSASGGIIKGGEYLFDGVRCGIMLYGYTPEGFKFSKLKKALKVYAPLVQTTRFIGGGTGYTKAVKNYGKLNTYRCGYADGFLRTMRLGEGNLCMDTFVKEGGEKLLCVMDDAEKYALKCGTISYEILTRVTKRAQIIYERRT